MTEDVVSGKGPYERLQEAEKVKVMQMTDNLKNLPEVVHSSSWKRQRR